MNAILENQITDTAAFLNADPNVQQQLAEQTASVKREVFAEYQAALGANDQLLRLAIIEADALARQTGYPHLVFPMLAEEKAQNAARWQFRQQFRLRSNDALAA